MSMTTDRRGALCVLGAVGAVSALAIDRQKSVNSAGSAMLLVDERDADRAQTMSLAMSETGSHLQRRNIGSDLLRQWRDGLGEEVLAAGSVVALVRWDHALTLDGLAREERRSTQIDKLPGGLFRVELG